MIYNIKLINEFEVKVSVNAFVKKKKKNYNLKKITSF